MCEASPLHDSLYRTPQSLHIEEAGGVLTIVRDCPSLQDVVRDPEKAIDLFRCYPGEQYRAKLLRIGVGALNNFDCDTAALPVSTLRHESYHRPIEPLS